MRFVLIDRLERIEPGRRALAHKRFDPEEPLFADHFPGFPVVPGTLLVEAMAQTGGWLVAQARGLGVWSALLMVRRAGFRKWVEPGEELSIEVTLGTLRGSSATTDAVVRVGGERRAHASLVFAITEVREDGPFSCEPTRSWIESTWRRLGGPAAVVQGRDGRPAS